MRVDTTELGISVLFNSLAYQFTDSPKAGALLISSLFFQSTCNLLIKEKIKNKSVAEIVSSHVFAIVTGSNMHMLIHEMGHALASKLVFKNANPKITLFPPSHAITHYEMKKLTPLGKFLGKRKAVILSVAAGPCTSFLACSLAMIVGKVVENRFKELANYLIASGRMEFFSLAFLAISAYSSSSARKSQDYFLLSKAGIPPSLFATIFVATPLLIEFKFPFSSYK